jgi:periplasmic divalent cation tolerance protein
MKSDCKIAVVQTSVASGADAKKLTALIIRNRLGACVQSLPVKSVYRWRGKIESAREYLVAAKTSRSAAGKLVAFIRKHHSYELPEIIVTEVRADRGYTGWVARETKSS